MSSVASNRQAKREQGESGRWSAHLPSWRVGTTRSTVLLCRVTNQTIVCSRTGYERGRERRSHIDPRVHQQLITQIYVPIVHCLSTGSDSLVPRRGPFDGSDWPVDPVETSRRTARRCTTTKRTTGRRREEIKGGPLGGSLRSKRVSKRGMQEVEEPSGRTTGGQLRPLRAWSVFYPSGTPLRTLDRKSVESICVPFISNPSCPLTHHLYMIEFEEVFRNFNRDRQHCPIFISNQRLQRALLRFRKQRMAF